MLGIGQAAPRAATAVIASLPILVAASAAVAGSFSVSPVRIELSAQQKMGVLTVRNEEDVPALVQVETLAWSQADGNEVHVPTRDVLATPPVFTLPPKGQQILRVALRRNADAARELSYRLALQEVVAEAPKESVGLRVALRISLPVFVQPSVLSDADLRWSARCDADGNLTVEATNHGNGHIQLAGFSVHYADSVDATFTHSGARYVLPGSRVGWTFKSDGEADRQAIPRDDRPEALTIRGFSDRGDFSTQVQTDLP